MVEQGSGGMNKAFQQSGSAMSGSSGGTNTSSSVGGGFDMGSLLALLGLGGGGGLLTGLGLSNLSDIGASANTQAQALAQELLGMSTFQPFTVTSATGGTFGVGTGPDGTGVTMTLSPEEQAFQQAMFGRAGDFFSQAAQGTAEREADIYQRMRDVMSPQEEQQRQAMEERLAAQGRLGVQTAQFGGTPEQLALAKAQEQAKNEAMFGAMQQARAEQAQQAALGSQFLGQSYMPQSQLLNVQQAAQLYPQLQQQAQLYGAGQYGETMLSGIEAQLLAEQAKANLIGGLGSSILGGLFTPVAQQGGGVGSLLSDLLGDLFN